MTTPSLAEKNIFVKFSKKDQRRGLPESFLSTKWLNWATQYSETVIKKIGGEREESIEKPNRRRLNLVGKINKLIYDVTNIIKAVLYQVRFTWQSLFKRDIIVTDNNCGFSLCESIQENGLSKIYKGTFHVKLTIYTM